MNDASWLMYANIAVWFGIGGYLLFLGCKTTRLESRISRFLYTEAKTAARDKED